MATTNRRRQSGALRTDLEVRSLLVLAQPSPETDDLLEVLVERTDLCLLRVTNLNGAEIALRDVAVSLVLVCPETDAATVNALLEKTERMRRGTPVLAIRPRGSAPLPAWTGRRIAVLSCPILSHVLSRSVDVALGLGT